MGKAVGQRVSDHTKGGFLDDVDVEVTDAIFMRNSYEVDDPDTGGKKTITETVCSVDFLQEGRDEPFNIKYKLPDSLRPAETEGGDEAEEGQFLVVAEGSASGSITETCQYGRFQAALSVKCEFPDDNWKQGPRKALTGLKGHTTTVEGGTYTDKKTNQKKTGRSFPVFASIEKDTIPKVKSGKAAPATKTAAPVKKGKPAPEPEVEEEEDDDIFPRVKELIAKKAAKLGDEETLTKSQLSSLINASKKFTPAELKAAVSWAINSENLKAGAEEGLWSFENGKVGPAMEEVEEEEEE